MSSGGRLTRGALAIAEDFASLSTRECLIFAQVVYEYGAKHWSEIAGILSKHPLISRPKNFFTAQSCVAIYNYLMNQAQLERTQDIESKKANVHLKLAQRHYVERFVELKRDIAAEEEKFRSIEQEIAEIRLGKQDHKWASSALSVPPSPKSQAGSPKYEKPKSSSVVHDPAPATDTSPLLETDTDVKDESMEISSPASNEHEVNIEEEIAEVKADDVPERQTRQSSRRRRSTGASQSGATPSPTAALRSASPNSPRIEDKPGSRTGQKPPSKGEQIEPIPELSLKESVEEDMRVEDDEDAEDGEEVKTSSEEVMDRMSEPADEDQTQELPVQSHESTPAPQGRRDRKRRASDLEGFPSESLREKKRAREESEPFDDADSPATPSASAVGTSKNQKERKRFQNVINMLHSQISQHRNGTIFHNPIKPSEAPDYHDIVKRPMDLKTIKNRVRDGNISSSSEYQRDIYLMFANSLMYNRPNSDIYTMAEEMMNDAEAHINSFRQTEGFTARTRT